MKKLIVFALSLTAAITTHAQQLNVPKNKQFELTGRFTQLGALNDDEQLTYAFKSLGKNAAGNQVFDCKLVKNIIKRGKEGHIILNTDSLHNTNFNSTTVLFPMAMLNRPFTVVVSPKGKVMSVEGVLSSLKEAVGPWNLKPDTEQMLMQNADKAFTASMQCFFFKFPEKEIAPASRKEENDQGLTFTLSSKKPNLLLFSSAKNDSAGNSYQSKHTIDRRWGLIQDSSTEAKYNPKGSRSTQYGSKSFVKMSTSVTKTLIDTSWVNMAVKFSSWSNAFRNKLGYDSVKVYAALNTYEAKFGNDRYYMVEKLDLIQQLKSRNSYKLYDSLLLSTPNKYLTGTHHLSNKLQESLQNQSAIATYEVSKYNYKTDSFQQWVQHSFAQGFLSDKGTSNPFANKCYELLELFMQDKDPVYQQNIKPLYLWAIAYRHPSNTALLIKNAAEFTKMNDAQMHSGNGGRYGLLLYDMLVQDKAQPEADSLLNHTIKKLKGYTANTENPYRYAEQNILAHAWYLKYKAALVADSAQALQYLAEAANYAPKEKKEKVYDSFYDRHFLKSKESYRDDYINALLKAGNETEALKMFAVHIGVNPENLDEMRKIYKTRFPNKDFKAFMISNVIGNWRTAPDFKLKKIDGKHQSLSDFKGKWLVLDFWGTWCGPCIEELPGVNKFYVELTEGKHGNTNFLSIACNDTEDSVKAFISANKYAIPVAMSDNKVEQEYKISGYPSKILVSPEGKMLNVDFGKDWKKILYTLNDIYALIH